MNLSIKSWWKRAGKVERAFAPALVLYLILRFAWSDSGLEAFVAFAAFVLGVWVALRLLRIGLRKLTWRLRNRLMVAYLFIAVLPILLVLTLVGLGAYILAGQVAVYLVRSELDRRVAALQAVAQDIGASPGSIQRIAPMERARFPGLILLTVDKGVPQTWPPDAQMSWPVGLPANSSGFASRDGRYYAWADVVADSKQALALEPLSRRYLSGIMPRLGDVYFVQREFLGAPDADAAGSAARAPRIDLRAPSAPASTGGGSTKLGAGGDEQFRFLPAGGDAGRSVVPPPVNRFDVGVRWGSVLRVMDWAHPGSTESALLVGYTRLSSILSTILSQSSDILEGIVLDVFYGVAVAFLLVAITGLIIGISMSRSITAAVHSLYQGTERVVRGDFSHLIRVKGRDQIAELSTSFNTMTQNLQRLLAVAKEKERMEAEIEIARGVQDQLYPTTPPVFRYLRVCGKCDPARMVSGDYYDYQLVDGKLAIAIGDVAGKGISAALLMATIQAALRMELRASADLSSSMNGQRFSTARIVSDLNQQLHATTSAEKYATFFLGIYDEATRLMTYTNAGHLQPLLIRDGAATLLDVSGLMVGAFPFAKYEESKIELRSGDLLVCYTDGVTEPENEYGEMFGEDRLINLVSKNSGLDEAQIIESVMDSVRQWTGVPELSDDMTVLLARKK